MIWYKKKVGEDNVILTSRVRFARNIAKLAFPEAQSENERVRIADEISKKYIFDTGYTVLNMSDITDVQALSYAEMHLCSPDFANADYSGRALVISKDEESSIMINEEDHFRIQTIESGNALKAAYDKALKEEKKIGEFLKAAGMKYAVDNKYGYLTACPTNIGCAMRASMMLHLPALAVTKKMNSLSEELNANGFTIRGFYGENSEARGALFQISNRFSLGYTPENIIERLEKISKEVEKAECRARDFLKEKYEIDIMDRLARSYGILTNAKKLTSSELVSFISDVKMLNYYKEASVDEGTLNRMLIELMPSCLALLDREAENEKTRDVLRAKEVQRRLMKG